MNQQKLWLALCVLAFLLLCFVCLRSHSHEQAAPVTATPASTAVASAPRLEGRMEGGRAMLAGTVGSAGIKASILGRARALFGERNVVDTIAVDGKAPRGAWGGGIANITSILGGRLANGSFALSPDSITLRGQVAGEDVRAGIVRSASEAVGPQVRVIDALTVVAKSEAQTGIDDFLKGKVIEFARASAVITPKGRQILDEALPLLRKAEGRTIEISGHTDNEGAADLNMKLSNERARAVKQYLVGKGLAAERLNTVGYGPARPAADNGTPQGRQQNRRIEFAIQ